MIYAIIVFIATLIGGISGMGGGVIIKPALDAMGTIDLASIGVLSSITVLTMSIVSVIRGVRGKPDKQLLLLALAGVAGGFVGNFAFSAVIGAMSEETVNLVQISLNLVLLLFCVLRNKLKTYHAQNVFAYIAVGLLLGALATFIGIGGGPINIALLTMVFGFDIKKAVISSLFIIMFSQTMNVGTIFVSGSMQSYNLEPLIYMIPSAVVGGLLGSVLCKKLSEKAVKIIYTVVVIGLVGLNIYNLVGIISVL